MFSGPLPFSGLSLLIHLAVISIASIFKFFGLNRAGASVLSFTGDGSFAHIAVRRAFAVAILISVASIMSSFVYIAISTGVREGENEWHRVLLAQAVSNALHYDYISDTFLAWVIEYRTGETEMTRSTDGYIFNTSYEINQ